MWNGTDGRGVVWYCNGIVGRYDNAEMVWYVGWPSRTVDEMLRIDTQCGERARLGIQEWLGIVLVKYV